MEGAGVGGFRLRGEAKASSLGGRLLGFLLLAGAAHSAGSCATAVPLPAGTRTAAASPAVSSPAVAGPLAWTLGIWEGARREPSTGTSAPMTLVASPILGGVGQEEQLEVRTERGVYRGFAVKVFDPQLGRWVMTYVNATRRQFVRLEGEPGAEPAEWRSTATDTGRRSRLVYERPGPGLWRRTMFVSTDGGVTWDVLWVDDLRARPQ